jgi:hypothetical protein
MHYKRRSAEMRLKNVQCVSRTLTDGRRRLHYYHRPTRIKLVGLPHTMEFMESYIVAEGIWRARREPPDDGRVT